MENNKYSEFEIDETTKYEDIINFSNTLTADKLQFLTYVKKQIDILAIHYSSVKFWDFAAEGNLRLLQRKLQIEIDYHKNENGNQPVSKIQWNGEENLLVYLVESLIEKSLLPAQLKQEPFAFIEKHFVKENGKPFKAKQLSQSKYQYEISKTGKPKKADIIDDISNKL